MTSQAATAGPLLHATLIVADAKPLVQAYAALGLVVRATANTFIKPSLTDMPKPHYWLLCSTMGNSLLPKSRNIYTASK